MSRCARVAYCNASGGNRAKGGPKNDYLRKGIGTNDLAVGVTNRTMPLLVAWYGLLLNQLLSRRAPTNRTLSRLAWKGRSRPATKEEVCGTLSTGNSSQCFHLLRMGLSGGICGQAGFADIYVQRKNLTARKNEIVPQRQITASGAACDESELPSRMMARSMSLSAVSGSNLMSGTTTAGKRS